MGLAFTDYAASTGALRALYDQLRAPPETSSTGRHTGIGIVTAHSLDPDLIGHVLATATSLADGPLAAAERELVYALTSRLNQCRYWTASFAVQLRAHAGNDALARTVIDDPRALATTATDARTRAIASLTHAITEAPWTLTRADLSRAHSASLSDEDVLHIVALAAFASHLARIADVTGIPLDEQLAPIAPSVPAPDPSTPAWPTAPAVLTGRPAIELVRRPATYAALVQWRKYIFYRDTQVTRRQRTLLARWVATWLGDGGISPPTDLTVNPHDDALRTFAELVTLSPWSIGDAELAPLRAAGFDDAAIFDVTATVTSAAVFSRIEVALTALGQTSS